VPARVVNQVESVHESFFREGWQRVYSVKLDVVNYNNYKLITFYLTNKLVSYKFSLGRLEDREKLTTLSL